MNVCRLWPATLTAMVVTIVVVPPAASGAVGQSGPSRAAGAAAAAQTRPGQTRPAPRTRPVEIVVADGFDWIDAGVGAAGGFAFALLLGAVLMLTERRQPRRLPI